MFLNLKIAISEESDQYFETSREVVLVDQTDFTDVSAIVVSLDDVKEGHLDIIKKTGFDIPVFVLISRDEKAELEALPKLREVLLQVVGVLDRNTENLRFYGDRIETAARNYEDKMLPPFFGSLKAYVEKGNAQFDCPGHQGGKFFRKHPAGRVLYDFFDEMIFRSDLCNADVAMGDLLVHEGPALEAQKYAAKVFNADKTYFVLNGSSAANRVITTALLTPGDLVLFDRNNHKSIHQGALFHSGALPVYLETSRNPFGFIGGVDEHCFDEDYLRALIQEVAPERSALARPFRLAIIQLGTYDGTVYNARRVVDKIGHLCDYILFDSACVGYEQFIPMMKDCSPLLLDLDEDDPGIFVTQSVHKQLAGFSQASQIHKKDAHIKGQQRYVNHHRLNNAFMSQASTSPFYPIYASIDVNAKIHDGISGQRLWTEALKSGIEARKLVLQHCQMIRPFIPTEIDGKLWQHHDTQTIANDLRFFQFDPQEKWHGFEGYGEDQYFVDPMKLMFTTPGIDPVKGEYTDFGIPASILIHFLRQNNIIPEKSDLNSILFLLTPAEITAKMDHLVAQLSRFERYIKEDAPMSELLPSLYKTYKDRYENYTIRQVCQEMHDLYKHYNIKELQKEMFRKSGFPKTVMLPQQANTEYFRGNVDFVPLSEIEGRIASEGGLTYPPGIFCILPGEVWGGAVLQYFLAMEDAMNSIPGFASELQGVYPKKIGQDKIQMHAYVLKQS